MHICVCLYMYGILYLSIYIERERETDAIGKNFFGLSPPQIELRGEIFRVSVLATLRCAYVYIYMYIHIYIYIYVNIYVYICM